MSRNNFPNGEWSCHYIRPHADIWNGKRSPYQILPRRLNWPEAGTYGDSPGADYHSYLNNQAWWRYARMQGWRHPRRPTGIYARREAVTNDMRAVTGGACQRPHPPGYVDPKLHQVANHVTEGRIDWRPQLYARVPRLDRRTACREGAPSTQPQGTRPIPTLGPAPIARWP